MEMGDNDAQCVRARIKKARSAWARIGRVLRSEGIAPRTAGKFFNAVVQAVLLYSSETWCLSEGLLKELQGFQTRAAWGIAREHKPRRMEGGEWKYPATDDVLREVGLRPIRKLIQARRAHIAMWVTDRPLNNLCRAGGRMRGSSSHVYWWELPMDLDEETSGPSPDVVSDKDSAH